IEVKTPAQKLLREMRQSHDRIFHRFAEHTPAEQIVINRHAEIELTMKARVIAVKIEIIAPACKEKFPLQLGQFVKLRAVVAAHPGFVERDKKRRDDHPF